MYLEVKLIFDEFFEWEENECSIGLIIIECNKEYRKFGGEKLMFVFVDFF